MPAPLGELLPAFDPAEKQPNSTLGPIEGDIEPLPTWHPDEIPKDAKLAVIHPNVVNGEEGSHDGSHPKHDERTAGSWDSDALHTGGGQGGRGIGPHKFARDGGTPRKK